MTETINTDTVATEPAAEDPTMTVRVAKLSGDTVTLDYSGDLTLGEYLAQANVTVDPGQLVTLNGRAALNMDEPVEPNSVVVVVGKVTNG
ncbi:MAG TPA: hypothetical protein VF572_05155 [Candidatus Saccharimonadales bacterium]|jgi:hypothetical protein